MADPKKLLEDATARAVVAAGRDAAKQAALDLLATDEEREAAQAEQARASKKRRNKLILFGVLGLFVLIGVIGMLVSYWHWFLLAGLGGIAGLVGYRWLQHKRRAAKRAAPARVETAPAKAERKAAERVETPEPKARVAADDALAEAEASEEAVEEELAALKARIQQSRRDV